MFQQAVEDLHINSTRPQAPSRLPRTSLIQKYRSFYERSTVDKPSM